MGVYQQMQDRLVDAGCALMKELSAEVVEVCDGGSLDVSTEVVVATIGYAADTCRGAIVLVSSPSFLRAIDAGVPAPASAHELGDMQGELSNMLLGLKMMMRKHGVTFVVATPTSIVGLDLALPPPSGGTSSWHRFASARGDLHVRFDAIFDVAFVLGATSAPEGDAAEGEVLVF